MTQEQVKHIIEWVDKNAEEDEGGFFINTDLLAARYLEANPQPAPQDLRRSTALPTPVTAPPDNVTAPPAPQDLRERVEKFVWAWALANNLNTYGNQKAISEIASSICVFISEVSAEKDREIERQKQRIAELELSLKQALMMAEAGNKGINQARQRIAELEEEIQNIHWDNIEAENKRDIS